MFNIRRPPPDTLVACRIEQGPRIGRFSDANPIDLILYLFFEDRSTMRNSLRSAGLAAGLSVALGALAFAAERPKAFISGLKNPESVCIGPDGRLYVTEMGERGADGDGRVTVVQADQPQPFASGLNDPRGIVTFQDALYLTDKNRVMRVDGRGNATVFAGPDAFPTPPVVLNDIAVDPQRTGVLLVSDSGDAGRGAALYQIDVRSKKVTLVANGESIPGLQRPNGVAFDGMTHAILADMGRGVLQRINLATRSVSEPIAEGLEGADGLVWDHFGRLFITSWKTGKLFGIPRPGQKPILIGEGFQSAADTCLDPTGKYILVPDMKAGTLTARLDDHPRLGGRRVAAARHDSSSPSRT